MKKLFFAAVVAAVASSHEIVQAYTNEATPRSILFQEGLVDVSYDYKFEVAYKAYFNNELDETNDGLEKDALGFNVYSLIKTQFYFTILDHFQFEIRFELQPFYITPLEMSLTYSRPAALLRGDDFSLLFKATHKVLLLDFVTTWRKDVKLPAVSILDALLDDTKKIYPTLAKSKFAETDEIEDPILSVDIFDLLVAQNFPDLTSWYGKGKYCDFDFVNDKLW
jgi:hypothetical protein